MRDRVMWQSSRRRATWQREGLEKGSLKRQLWSWASFFPVSTLTHLPVCALPATYLVCLDQGLHSQVVFHQLVGLGPAWDWWPSLRDHRAGLWLRQTTRCFLTGFLEEAVPRLGRVTSKKTARSEPGRSWGWHCFGLWGMLGVPSPP